MDLFTLWFVYLCIVIAKVTVSCKEWMQSTLPPSLQKNIVGRGRPLLYVYTCADFVHVKNVSNLSSGCYKNINIFQIKKKRRTFFNSEYVLFAICLVYISCELSIISTWFRNAVWHLSLNVVVQSRRASVLHPSPSSDPLDARRYSLYISFIY